MADADTPRGRIAAAIEGKPAKAYAKVVAADVVAVGNSIEDHTTVTAALTAGAGAAISERVAATDPESIEVFQIAGQLAQLLEVAGAEPVPKGA